MRWLALLTAWWTGFLEVGDGRPNECFLTRIQALVMHLCRQGDTHAGELTLCSWLLKGHARRLALHGHSRYESQGAPTLLPPGWR